VRSSWVGSHQARSRTRKPRSRPGCARPSRSRSEPPRSSSRRSPASSPGLTARTHPDVRHGDEGGWPRRRRSWVVVLRLGRAVRHARGANHPSQERRTTNEGSVAHEALEYEEPAERVGAGNAFGVLGEPSWVGLGKSGGRAGASKLACSRWVGGLGVVQAACRYSLMSPPLVGCRRSGWAGRYVTTSALSGARWARLGWGRCVL